jgi:hypothetical protein
MSDSNDVGATLGCTKMRHLRHDSKKSAERRVNADVSAGEFVQSSVRSVDYLTPATRKSSE